MNTAGIKSTTRPSDEEIFARDGFMCIYCGFDGRSFEGWQFLEVDHFKPRCLGGGDDRENLVTSCAICNRLKGANYWESRDRVRAEIGKWRAQMREFYNTNVSHLVRPKGSGSIETSVG